MGKVHICLKRSFIFVASVIAIINASLLIWVLCAHAFYLSSREAKDMHYVYIFLIIPLVLVVFGLVGVCKKKKWAVIVFTSGMILLSLIMLLIAVVVIGNKSEILVQLADEIRNDYLAVGPLSKSDDAFKQQLSEQQEKFQCCGLDHGYTDWGEKVPQSCKCTGRPGTNPCVEIEMDDNTFFTVYEKPCLPYLVEDDMQYADVVLGLMIALAVFWLLGSVLSIVILCKLYEKDHIPAVVYRS